MPNIKSAEKRLRTSQARADRNRRSRSRLRSAIKNVRLAESQDDAQKAFRSAVALIDRAASRRLIHPNKAARAKSQLERVVASK